MHSISGLDNIFTDHFRPYKVETNSNRFEIPHALFVGALPALIGAVIAIAFAQFVADNSGAIVAVYAVMASVMTAIMPTINGLIGPVDRNRIAELKTASVTGDANIREAKVLIAKVEIVRSLYAAVAWSVIVLCASLVPLLIISHPVFKVTAATAATQPVQPVEASATLGVFRMIFAGMIGFAGCTAFTAMLQIVSGVHLMLRHSQVDVEKDLKGLSNRYHV